MTRKTEMLRIQNQVERWEGEIFSLRKELMMHCNRLNPQIQRLSKLVFQANQILKRPKSPQ